MQNSENPSAAAGLPPGTLKYIGEERTHEVSVTVIQFDDRSVNQEIPEDIRDCYECKTSERVSWINVDGVYDIAKVKALGAFFDLHPLLLEDIVDTEQRPKVDFYEGLTIVILRMLYYRGDESEIYEEQISLVQGENFLISFQESPGDVFDNIRQRLDRHPRGKLRNSGAAYLCYAMMDSIVDNYFIVMEKIARNLEDLEHEIIRLRAPRDPTTQLYELKQKLTSLRKAVRPLREIVQHLIRQDKKSAEDRKMYLRDLYDHVVQVTDNVESYLDMTKHLLDLYLSVISNKTTM
ncbi:MAG: magnesium and cobalt transport protein CorA [Bacteroidia bacterium]|nr:magnesium and cobalt transport protein CorA [Bacteroidia bacterium]